MQHMDRGCSLPFQSAAGRRIVADRGMNTNQDRWDEALVKGARIKRAQDSRWSGKHSKPLRLIETVPRAVNYAAFGQQRPAINSP
jgi:hypothetical protein